MRGRVNINGVIHEPLQARISVFDRGFLYGDSVYETLRVYGGVPFALDDHLERLYFSGELVGFALPWPPDRIRAAIVKTLDTADLPEGMLRIIATRGSGDFGLDPGLAADPQLVVMSLELPAFPPAAYEQGRSACLVSVKRNFKQAINPQAKTGNYMNNVLAAGEARRRHADEAIMLDLEGRIAEGSSANVFALLGDTWCTPPLEVGILSGITRRTTLDLCARHGIAAAERILWPEDLRAASEIFLCSSLREIMPMVTLDGVPVGNGRVGPGCRQLHGLYRAEVRAQTVR